MKTVLPDNNTMDVPKNPEISIADGTADGTVLFHLEGFPYVTHRITTQFAHQVYR